MPRILIVDDDPQSRHLLARAVYGLDVVCHCCSDGIHALDALRCNPDYDLVIADVAMPVLGGRQLLEVIRSDEDLCHLPVLITSGVAGPTEITQLLDLGAAAFLPKPLNVPFIRDSVAVCLDAAMVATPA
ncbi:MAG: response regulator [bacterium]|nr:response regulator [bacterium]